MNKAQLLQKILLQTSPAENIESIPQPLPRTSGGMESTGPQAVDPLYRHAASGLEKLKQGRPQELTSQEQFGLEAIVLPENRPVVFIRKGIYDSLGGIWTGLNSEGVRNRLQPLLHSIGRIEMPNDPTYPYGGTGFVVGKGLLMTNRHVARLFAVGLGTSQRITYTSGDAAINFRREFEGKSDDAPTLIVTGVEMIHPFWDMALLRVEGLPADAAVLPISTADPESLRGRNVVTIGYPAQDLRNDMALQDRIFSSVYNVKRLHPGKICPREPIQSFENTVNAVTHDCSTLGGNSGSAVIDVETGHVVALHFAGIYLRANYAVPTFELARDSRVVQSGVNFQGSVDGTNEFEPAWNSTEESVAPASAQVSEIDTKTDSSTVSTATAPTLITTATGTTATLSFSIPVEISVKLGNPVIGGAAQSVTGIAPGPAVTIARGRSATELEAPRTRAEDYDKRNGYSADFLGGGELSIPIPLLKKRSDLVRVERAPVDRPFELRYQNFSVVMSKSRRLCCISAVNIDGSATFYHPKRPGWKRDPRVDAALQVDGDSFYIPTSFDRGHMVRRLDPVWGTESGALLANADTHHYTNSCPQVHSFNDGAWGDLEDWILSQEQTLGSKGTVFTGPIFENDDPKYEGVAVPRRYFKIIVVVDNATKKLTVTAFLKDQTDVLPPVGAGHEAPFNIGRFKEDQRTVAEIEKLTGLDFGRLKQFDVRAGQSSHESVGSELKPIPLTSARDAVLWARR